MLRNTLITFNPKNPDEQEFNYSYDPAYELNMTDEELMHERIQLAMMRARQAEEEKNEQQGQTKDVQSEDRA